MKDYHWWLQLLFLLAVPGLSAQEVQPSLLQRSPFIPPDFTPGSSGPVASTASPAAPGTFELRGVYRLGDEYRFLVSPANRGEGRWVELGKAYDDFEVRRFDVNSETLTLFYNNEETRITLANVDANPTPIPVSGQTQPPAAGTSPRPSAPRITRRAIRPTSRTTNSNAGTPPPWLEKLREEAAARRAQAAQSRFDNKEAQEAAGEFPESERTDIPVTPEVLQELKNSAPQLDQGD